MEPNTSTAVRGPQLRSIVVRDAPESWRSAGFDVRSDGGVSSILLGSSRIVLRGTEGGFAGWSFDGMEERGSLAGVPLLAEVAWSSGETPYLGSQNPNGIDSFDHVVLTTGSSQRTSVELSEAGFVARRSRDSFIGDKAVVQSFYWAGDVIIEMVGPLAAGASSDPQAALWGLALVSSDIHATKAMLGDLISDPRPAVQPDRMIAAFRGEKLGITVPVAIMSPHRGRTNGRR